MEIYVRSLFAITDVRAIKSAYSAGSNRPNINIITNIKASRIIKFFGCQAFNRIHNLI